MSSLHIPDPQPRTLGPDEYDPTLYRVELQQERLSGIWTLSGDSVTLAEPDLPPQDGDPMAADEAITWAQKTLHNHGLSAQLRSATARRVSPAPYRVAVPEIAADELR
jgi:hypothetical protein